jgi:hypothetical protein
LSCIMAEIERREEEEEGSDMVRERNEGDM